MINGKTAALLAAVALLTLGGRGATAAGSGSTANRPRPSTFSVSISGPHTVQPGYTCQWTAVVSGGTPPYDYVWVGLGSYGFDETYSGTTSGFGYASLYLEVHDGNGDEATAGKSIGHTGYGCGY